MRGQAWIRLTSAHLAIANPPIKYDPVRALPTPHICNIVNVIIPHLFPACNLLTRSQHQRKTGSRFLKQIDLDVARTHRDHILYKARYSEKYSLPTRHSVRGVCALRQLSA